MANQMQGAATIFVIFDTEMTEQQCRIKMEAENIIAAKLTVTLSDGSVHTLSVCEFLETEVTDFETNDEEYEEDIIIENKVTKSNDSVTKLAI